MNFSRRLIPAFPAKEQDFVLSLHTLKPSVKRGCSNRNPTSCISMNSYLSIDFYNGPMRQDRQTQNECCRIGVVGAIAIDM